ncbi:TRAP transporter small permease subunit [Marinomonas colpomeniae]|uniref:TRAP transporter small permease protein n=1 Tax=Marinomonas colpomeniae TaxID=2774408 RepID=A0ABR8NWW5_9GAMM|nr:TRAP transporter small permease subunit [Marinomonas colpomeniae]MBD5770543.1 TRAP transporter small permease subunit [Marinomonas colpomeniae]
MLLKIENSINKLIDAVGVIAGMLLIILVLVISYNVVGRYAFGISSVALEEFSWHLYSSLFLLGISYALRTESHVRVDIIFENLSIKTQSIINVVGSLVALFPLCLIVIYYGWGFMMDSYQLGSHPDTISGWLQQFFTTGIGEKSSDPGGLLNRFIIRGMIPLSFLLLALSTVSFFLKNLNILMGQSKEESGVTP